MVLMSLGRDDRPDKQVARKVSYRMVVMGDGFQLPPRMLRSDLILPGDILLTNGREKDSKWIARLSGGDFSHAALVIN